MRKRHGVAPTPAGQSLLEHARGMLAGAARIERDMQAFASGVRGQVRILASASAMAESLADIGNLQHRGYRSDHLCMAVPAGHPLASSTSLRIEQTLDYGHVSLPVSSAVQVMLQRAAARIGRSVNHRVIVSNFEAALRVVRAGLAISLVPREVAELHARAWGLKLIPMAEPWARRRFIICFRDAQALSPAAQLLVDHLTQQDTP